MLEESSQRTLLISSHIGALRALSNIGHSHRDLIQNSVCLPGRRRGSIATSAVRTRLPSSSFCVRHNSLYSQIQDDFDDRQLSCSAPQCIAFSINSMATMRNPSIDKDGNILDDGALRELKISGAVLGLSINREGNLVVQRSKFSAGLRDE
eukprot:765830-Hanusia_phi.AAC.3